VRHANRILAETVKTLKDSGNAAFKAGNLGLAAHRYDKAIQYGSVAYMKNRKILICRFDDLLKNLVMTRLNMALVLLTENLTELALAAKQAKLAIKEISPYCDPNKNDSKGKEISDEALVLKTKACFRLGSAQYEMGDYSDAIYSLEESIKSSNEISNPVLPDYLVLRRLANAKREHLKHTKRQRKKFKFAFVSSSSQRDSCACTAPSIPLQLPSPTPSAEKREDSANNTASDATAHNLSTAVTTSNTVTPMK